MNERAKALMRHYADGYSWRRLLYVVLVALSVGSMFFDGLKDILHGIALSAPVVFILAEREEHNEVEKLANACVEYRDYTRELEEKLREAKYRIEDLERERR